jgi:N-acyl-D-amino-acid deacylase
VAITRGPSFDLPELSRLSLTTGRPVTWTALVSEASSFDLLEQQQALGGNVWPQVSCRPIVMLLTLSDPGALARAPAFAEILAQARDQRPVLYRDAAWRDRIRADFARLFGGRYDRVFVQETEAHLDLKGRSIADIAAERAADPLDTWVDLALAEDLRTRFRVVIANDNEPRLGRLLSDDRTLLGLSDAGAHASQLCDAVFSTFLLEHWVRELGVLSLEKAVWRLSSHPAEVFGLERRGRIAPGYAADLVAFDADTVGPEPAERVFDLPGGADRLVAASHGVEGVWVNGVASRLDGKDLPGVRAGTLIRHSS